jgi:2-keto-3-deoxy-L-rhamnonate aldolase RhmA
MAEKVANEFRARLKRGDKLLGTMVTLASAASAEVLASIGFDWLFIDGEHGPLETRELAEILQAVSHKTACIVRVPQAAEVPIKRALDLGAHGIIVPQVNTAAQAADVVRWSRYAPDGERGVGLARAQGYGQTFREYLRSANDEVAVIVQAEHARAVDNIEAIAKVPGVDAVLLGPYDLSASLGLMGQIDDPVVVTAIRRVTEACRAARMPLGYFGVTAAAVQPYAAQGYTLLVAGVDTLYLAQGAKALLGELKGFAAPGGRVP